MKAQYSLDFFLTSLGLISLIFTTFSLIYPVYMKIKEKMYSRIQETLSEHMIDECDISRITGMKRELKLSSPIEFVVSTPCGAIHIKEGTYIYSFSYYH